MEALNQALFLWLNASAHSNGLLTAIAIFFAEYAIWLLPAMIGISWLRGGAPTRKILLIACVSALAGMLISQIIGMIWPHPRPFMIGLGHTLIVHAADASFPSDHLTLWWSVAFSFLLHRSLRLTGIALALLGLPVAWSRIYLGVHFPLDMLGAAMVAALSAWLALRTESGYLPAAYNIALSIHRILFAKLIRLGWVRQ